MGKVAPSAAVWLSPLILVMAVSAPGTVSLNVAAMLGLLCIATVIVTPAEARLPRLTVVVTSPLASVTSDPLLMLAAPFGDTDQDIVCPGMAFPWASTNLATSGARVFP